MVISPNEEHENSIYAVDERLKRLSAKKFLQVGENVSINEIDNELST
jgi:hypothetical protein